MLGLRCWVKEWVRERGETESKGGRERQWVRGEGKTVREGGGRERRWVSERGGKDSEWGGREWGGGKEKFKKRKEKGERILHELKWLSPEWLSPRKTTPETQNIYPQDNYHQCHTMYVHLHAQNILLSKHTLDNYYTTVCLCVQLIGQATKGLCSKLQLDPFLACSAGQG